uniref:Uncharacterized protein n=1 Tax=Opuntia streptacantha TaxID=393608 RepID=A0A7C9DFB1_OPUST
MALLKIPDHLQFHLSFPLMSWLRSQVLHHARFSLEVEMEEAVCHQEAIWAIPSFPENQQNSRPSTLYHLKVSVARGLEGTEGMEWAYLESCLRNVAAGTPMTHQEV